MAAVLSDRLARLDAYLDRHFASRWRWGAVDCCLFCADWVLEERGIDPAAPFRGAYADGEAAQDLIRREGGFLPMIGALLDELGLERTGAPREGDIGIVNAPYRFGQSMPAVQAIGAIRARGGLWAMKGIRGLVLSESVPMIAGWAV